MSKPINHSKEYMALVVGQLAAQQGTDTDPAYLSAHFLLEWIESGKDGFPDESLLGDAVQYARIAKTRSKVSAP